MTKESDVVEKTIHAKLEAIKNKVKAEAMWDREITHDEQEMINIIDEGIGKLDKLIHDALEDGIVTEKEQLKINEMLQKIENEALSVAEFDDKVSDEEIAILTVLFENLGKLQAGR